MAASFPSGIKSYTTKLSGDTVQSSHVNDLQDEVTAIETALVGGTLPAANGSALTALNASALTSGTVAIARLGAVYDVGLAEGRLTLTSGTPVTVTDVTAATSVYYTPYKGNRVALYDGSAWDVYTFTEKTLAVPATTSQMYDVFLYNNAGTLTLEALAWTNDTTRATALTTQDGVLVKSGATTRRYLGSFRTTTVSGQTEDSLTKRYLWNFSHRVRRAVQRLEATATWTYTTAAFRQANASSSNQIAVVVGVAESLLELAVTGAANNSTGGINFSVSIGEDSTTAAVSGVLMSIAAPAAGINGSVVATLRKYPAVGFHTYAWLEYSVATGTTTWQGASVAYLQSGMTGSIEG